MDVACRATASAGHPCTEPVDASAPVPLCAWHLLQAYDWVARDVGVTDLLPSACLACGSRLGVSYPSGWLCAVCEWRYGDVPDDDLERLRVDVVYYIRFGDRIKIGTTGNPRQRMSTLVHDELLAFERGDRAVEQARHLQFADSRLGRSEWFAITDPLTTHIGQLAAGVGDPWARFARWRSELLARGPER